MFKNFFFRKASKFFRMDSIIHTLCLYNAVLVLISCSKGVSTLDMNRSKASMYRHEENNIGRSLSIPHQLQQLQELAMEIEKGNVTYVKNLQQEGQLSSIIDYYKSHPEKRGIHGLLHLAAIRKHGDMLHLLLEEGLDPNEKDEEDFCALHYACGCEAVRDNMSLPIKERKLGKKARAIIAQDDKREDYITKLDKKSIEYLLDKKADPNAKDEHGNTPLYYLLSFASDNTYFAHDYDNENSISSLDTFNVKYRYISDDPKMYMACVQLLIDYGAKVDERNIEGCTPLHGLLLSIQSSIDTHLKDCLKDIFKFPFFFEKNRISDEYLGDMADSDKDTLLHYAARIKLSSLGEEIISFLCADSPRGAAANRFKKNNEGNTPLHVAAREGHCHAIRSLTKELKPFDHVKCYLNRKNNKGRTALHEAVCEHNNHECIDLLLELGANKNLEDLDGNKPIKYRKWCNKCKQIFEQY